MTLPTLPLVDPNQLADAGQLSALKQAAAKQSPQALREAARQFESLFVSMVLKSMQQANFKDPLFGSDQGDLYQDMYDDQMAAVMSRGKGLGLADMLVQQLRREGAGATDAAEASRPAGATVPSGADTAAHAAAGIIRATTSTKDTAASGAAAEIPCPSGAQQTAFTQALWPDAQRAARQLGVSPITLLAQAALETNWGRSVPEDASGGTSNNLFGIKAASAWSGAAVASTTQEYSGGIATTVKARFRSYDSTRQCFQDYVELLKGSPRYAAALGAGNDVQAFGSALQQGGYATDPAYASKLTAVAGTLTRTLTRAAAAAAAAGA
ncbi:MAG TPA: flagellar assembly peptidoglycan hydrolase FlgJ, partial [Steroidobacteraceae bacterium]|nr:flagellar assembly peptidoglycan hydrolase FlgJ [Steroidobacteraceae bacterium]